jgi:Na+/glutamate symporter
MPELSQDCVDMSNAASTYLGIIAGAIIGGIVSWWIYNRQKKISNSQDYILHRIKELEENHDAILKKLADFDDKHESTLDAMKELHQKVDLLIRSDDES